MILLGLEDILLLVHDGRAGELPRAVLIARENRLS